MTKNRYIVMVIILFLLQIVLLKSFSLSTWFFPAPLVFTILSLERGLSAIKGIVLLFLIGMGADLLSSGIPGLWSASLLAAFIPRLAIIKTRAWENDDDLYDMPSLRDYGAGHYFFLAVTVNLVFFLVYSVLEKFSFSLTLFDITRVALSALLNSVLMVILIVISQPQKKKSR